MNKNGLQFAFRVAASTERPFVVFLAFFEQFVLEVAGASIASRIDNVPLVMVQRFLSDHMTGLSSIVSGDSCTNETSEDGSDAGHQPCSDRGSLKQFTHNIWDQHFPESSSKKALHQYSPVVAPADAAVYVPPTVVTYSIVFLVVPCS